MYKKKHGFNQIDMQDMNRSLLLNLLRKENVCARTELAKMSSLKQATVTNIVNDFINWGLVKETGFLPGIKGRRSIGITINNDDYGIIGVQLARKHYFVGLYNLSGSRIDHVRINLESEYEPRIIMDDIIALIQKFIDENKNREILAIGMALPGPYNSKTRKIELMTGYMGWGDINIQEELENRFNVPVHLEHDANAGAIAQYWYDEERCENDSFAYIADGQGVGAGIIVHGELLKGSMGTAGEIGHMSINYNGPRCSCGNYGCLEHYCSTIELVKEVNRILKPDKDYTFSEVKKMIQQGNPIAKEVFSLCCDYLAIGIANIINIFNPAVIVIGDEMAHIIPDEMLERVKQRVKTRVLPDLYNNVTIRMSSVEDSMINGAAIVAIKDIFDRPAFYFDEN